MDAVGDFLARFGTAVHAAAVVVGAIVVLAVLHRVLQRGGSASGGRRFRNQLVVFIASIAAILLVILALPLDGETRGQLLSLFGIVVSATIALSSSTFLGNAMAGIMLKSVRSFRSGDFVTVGEHFGRVSERGLFHTELQTPDRDLVTLPNLHIATNPVRIVRTSGTVVSATCSLGYDVHHGRIEELLLGAVAAADLSDGFVQVLELGDFAVTYKAAGLLGDVKSLLAARSRLRAAMLDALHAGGVEIVSPSFRNVRSFDADRPFIPASAPRRSEPAQDAAPVDVVFDKAEQAEALDARRQRLEELQRELKEAEQAARDAASAQTESWARRRTELLRTRIAQLEQAISAGAQDDDESGTG